MTSNSQREFFNLLEAAGLTQAELAREVGVTRGYINDIVKGRRPPSAGVLAYLHRRNGRQPSCKQDADRSAMSCVGVQLDIDAIRAHLANIETQIIGARNMELHLLLDLALPPDVDERHRAQVRGYLQALIDGRG